MLRSCRYCGKIHDSRFDCGSRTKKIKRVTDAEKFRGSPDWQRMREKIRIRDNNMCQCCIRNLPGTMRRISIHKLSVHHIEPLEHAYDKRLDPYNLILLDGYHHEMAEKGEISKETLLEIAQEQEAKSERYPPGC